MRILVLDIETSPNLVWAWDSMLWTQPIPYNYIVEQSYMMCWAAKWVDKKAVYFRRNNQVDFLTKLWELIDQADAIITYNGKKFDKKYINSEFIEAGLIPPTLYHDIDLYPTVRSNFHFPSNKLVYVAKRLLGHTKLSTGGVGLWFAALNNEAWAWKKMKEYNIQDIIVTEELYTKIKGWIPNHPNHGLYVEDQENPICRNCGSGHVKENGNEYDTTGVFAYKRYRCNDCGANLRGREAVGGKKATSLQVVK